MARFHPLTVSAIDRDTRESVILTLTPADDAAGAFAFTQGQYLTLRREFDGQELRRSYSICSGLDDGTLRVGVRRVEGGAFSGWANDLLTVGEVIDAMPPMGAFHAPLAPDQARNYLFFAGGSGITPILSIIRTVLAREPGSTATLVYANRQINTIMFREEIEDLKNIHLGRLSVIHVLEADAQDIDLFTGRLDADKLAGLFKGWIDVASADLAFICGPEPMMLVIAQALRDAGMEDGQIKFELFASAQPGRAPRREKPAESGTANDCEATVTLDGTSRTFRMPKDGQSLLDAAIANALDAPYACKAGVCSTCRAKVLEGEVEMVANHALEDYEVKQGYVLTCQCYPLTDRLVVTYDE